MVATSVEIRKITLSAWHKVKEALFPAGPFPISGDFCEGEEVAPQPDNKPKSKTENPPKKDKV